MDRWQLMPLPKPRFFREETIRVLNRDDSVSISFGRAVNPSLVRTFGLNALENKGDFGIEQFGAFPWLSYEDEEGEVLNIIPANSLFDSGKSQ